MKRMAIGLVLWSTFATAAWAAGDPMPRVDPETVGLSSERLGQITAVIGEEIENGELPGAVVLVARRGKTALFEAIGFRDRAAAAPMTADAIFRIYSMTKPIVSVAAMTLVEDGKMHLAEPISKYLPAFSEMTVAVAGQDPETGAETVDMVAAARPITVQDLLRHTSGLGYAFLGDHPALTAVREAGLASFSLDMTIAEYARELAALPLVWQPGTTWEYGRSSDVLGALVEAVSGRPLDDFVAQRILGPLGMVDSGFSVPPEKHQRIAAPQPYADTGETDNLIDVTVPPKMFAGGHGMVATVADYARFCQMMLNGGSLDGARILGPRTVAYIASDHVGESIAKTGTRYLPGPGNGFGLGFGVRVAAGEAALPGSVGGYYWGGYAGTYFWIDPVEELVVVWMSQRVRDRQHYRHLLRNLVYQAIID